MPEPVNSTTDNSDISFKEATLHYKNGNTLLKINDFQGAIEEYTTAIDLYPDSAKALNSRGMVKMELKDYIGAITDLNKAIRYDPKLAEAYNRGFAKIKLGRRKSGGEDLSKAGELGHLRAYEAIKKYCQ